MCGSSSRRHLHRLVEPVPVRSEEAAGAGIDGFRQMPVDPGIHGLLPKNAVIGRITPNASSRRWERICMQRRIDESTRGAAARCADTVEALTGLSNERA
jgi:hypothetical protein